MSCLGCRAVSGPEWQKTDIQDFEPQALFAKAGNTATYRATISYKQNDFTGLMVLKNLDGLRYRVAVLSDLGVTLLDFELDQQAFILHTCPEALRRKALLKLLETDFRLLFTHPKPQLKGAYKREKPAQTCLKQQVGKKKASFFYQTPSGELEGIRRRGIGPENTFVELTPGARPGIPQNILLRHPFLKLSLRLSILKK